MPVLREVVPFVAKPGRRMASRVRSLRRTWANQENARRSDCRMEQTPEKEGEEMSLESKNMELPTCPECCEPLPDPAVMFHGAEFDATVEYVTCKCGERIRVIVKRLYDTEVVI